MLLELKHIKKYFLVNEGFGRKKKCVRAVDDVDLTIAPGESFGLVGESGCGKTTLAKIIMRLMAPDAGQIIFAEKDITRISGRELRLLRKNFQMIFQDPFSSLDPRFTVYSLIEEALLTIVPQRKELRKTIVGAGYHNVDWKMPVWQNKGWKRSQKEDYIRGLLSSVGLPKDILTRYPHEFSGGERQRVAIARSLAMMQSARRDASGAGGPRLLILDEAVSSLDVLVQDQIIGLLTHLQKEFSLTYLFISHNLRVVRKLCRRIAVMYRGKIVELASTAEILADPRHPYTRQLLSAAIHYKVSAEYEEEALTGQLADTGQGHLVRA